MRKFVCSLGEEVDLDNPDTFKYLPDSREELRLIMFTIIGMTHCYMDYWHPDIYNGVNDGGQRERVNKMIENFTNDEKNHYDDIMWYKEQIFLFEDETENMC